MNKPAAIYSRVSSDRQKENHAIASQTAALIEYAQTHGYSVPPEWVFQDEGDSGAILVRPGLEALRDLAAEGQITAVLVYSPDRLSRKYAYQVLLIMVLCRCESCRRGVPAMPFVLLRPAEAEPSRSCYMLDGREDRRMRPMPRILFIGCEVFRCLCHFGWTPFPLAACRRMSRGPIQQGHLYASGGEVFLAESCGALPAPARLASMAASEGTPAGQPRLTRSVAALDNRN